MRLATYVVQAMRTAKQFDDLAANFEHATLGLITELGELTTEVKRQRIYLKPIDMTHATEEIGDVLWYWALGAHHLLDLTGVTESFDQVQAHTMLDMADDVPPDVLLSRAVRRAAVDVGEFGATSEAQDYTEAAECLGDLLRCLAAVCAVLGLRLEDCADSNITKLKLRFPAAFSEADAEARADKGGLDARVS